MRTSFDSPAIVLLIHDSFLCFGCHLWRIYCPDLFLYQAREAQRDSSNGRLYEHGICIRHCQDDSNLQPVPSQVRVDYTRPQWRTSNSPNFSPNISVRIWRGIYWMKLLVTAGKWRELPGIGREFPGTWWWNDWVAALVKEKKRRGTCSRSERGWKKCKCQKRCRCKKIKV